MKNKLTILLLLTMLGSAYAQKKKDENNPIIGSWKFSNQSAKNDFQKVFENGQNKDLKSEFFTFDPNHTFKHDFISKSGILLKSLKGKWKSIGDKIRIEYSDIDFSLSFSYFFLDKDLVLGQNFSHVIFTKDNIDFQNVAIK